MLTGSKSEDRLNSRAKPYFEDVTTRMRERHCDLIGRHKHLKDKITTLERSIPALMAYNMWTAGLTCIDAPYCKIREIMKKFSTRPDPTEKLLDDLRKRVKILNGETADLHEKIIDADMKLEEASMQLESLELANREMEDAENNLEKEIRRYDTPSLDSIHSDDLMCLTKIQQLAKEELSLKNCIGQLEKKEAIFKEQIDRLLTSRDFRSRRTAGRRVHESGCNRARVQCPFQNQKEDMECGQREVPSKNKEIIQESTTDADNGIDNQTINKINGKRDETKSAGAVETKSWISSWWRKSASDRLSDSRQVKTSPTTKKDVNVKPCVAQTPKIVRCKEEAIQPCVCVSSKYKKVLQSLPTRGKIDTCSNLSATKTAPHFHGRHAECVSERGAPKECLPLRGSTDCRCNCKGRCAHGSSDVPCECGIPPSLSSNKDRTTAADKLNSVSRQDDSNSEEEFCDCCSCGCEESDATVLCRCN
ncbi:hypothetical protein KM043_006469 [Ampulex compressa]|nr:hypothetical protein KM043_006469 [Ampulex compressa]